MNHLQLIFIFILITNSLNAKAIFANAKATKDSKKLACGEALKLAQQEALHQSGINVFTSYSKKQTQISDGEIKTIINKNTNQESYGNVITVSKTVKTKYNENTGQITCELNGKFKVDTSKLKAQLKALEAGYKNKLAIQKELEQKRNTLEQLKNKIKREKNFFYDDKYNCGDSISINECKLKLTKQIKLFALNKFSQKYKISKDSIKINSLQPKTKLKIITENGLTASYRGNVDVSLGISSSYIDKINSLNAYEQSRYANNNTKYMLTPIKFKQYNKIAFTNRNSGDGIFTRSSIEYTTLNINQGFYLFGIHSYGFKVGIGKSSFNIDNYDRAIDDEFSTIEIKEEDLREYNYATLGVETVVMMFAIPFVLQYEAVIFNGEILPKLDYGIGWNWDSFSLFLMTDYSKTTNAPEWQSGGVFKIGYVF